MKIELFSRMIDFSKLPAGAIFRSARVHEEFLAIKVASEQRTGWIVIDPPSPEPREGALFVITTPMGSAEKPVLEVVDAIFRPSLDFADWSLDEQAVYGSGDIVLGPDGKVYLCAIAGQNECHVDLSTGRLAEVAQAWAVVRKWSVIRMIDGAPHALAEFTSRRGKRKPASVAAAE